MRRTFWIAVTILAFLALAAPPQANAQVSFGVSIGDPYYYNPYYTAGYYPYYYSSYYPYYSYPYYSYPYYSTYYPSYSYYAPRAFVGYGWGRGYRGRWGGGHGYYRGGGYRGGGRGRR
jgi:hypothetical protein